MEKLLDYIGDPVCRSLVEALSGLMETARFDDISTSDIIHISGVSRSTFYRRYRDKYDLLNQIYQLVLDHTFSQITEGHSFRTEFYALYDVLLSAPAFFKNALSSSEPDCLRNYIHRQVYATYAEILEKQGIDMSSSYYRLLLEGYITGSLQVTCAWVQNGMIEPIDTIFRITYELMPHQLQVPLSLYYM